MSGSEEGPSTSDSSAEPTDAIELLRSRDVPLGGQRALVVQRSLPQRARTMIGPWCFADLYGPTPAPEARTMDTRPHPHAGLQTVSWLFAGRIEHRDSLGSHAYIEPGIINLMTAGRGIQHSEVSTADARVLHGVQLWIALPEHARHASPSFQTFAPHPINLNSSTARVFIGELLGSQSPVTTFSPCLGVQIDIPPHTPLALPIDAEFEHGALVVAGSPVVCGRGALPAEIVYVPAGTHELVITSSSEATRVILLGGKPLGEEIVMWWNFVGRSHEEILAFRERWQSEVIDGQDSSGLFGEISDARPLPAPPAPNVRLRPRA